MKRKVITIGICVLIVGSIGVVLANNKAKINKAANPEKHSPVIPVKTSLVQQDSFAVSFNMNGITTPEKEVAIASEVQGKLVDLMVENGDVVNAGQVIAKLDASVYSVQLSSIDASIAKARLDIARYTNLLEIGGATPMQIESVELQYRSLVAQKQAILEQIAHMQIRAPFSGRIENLKVEKGSFVSYGTVLGQLINNTSLKIDVYLSEQQAFKVKQGQPVIISSVVLKQPKRGRINMISDKADASGKFLTEIIFNNNEKDNLKAGILADVSFAAAGVETGLSIPVSSLLAGAQDARVYVVNGDKAEQRVIKTGIVTAGKVQVLEGLQAGEQVVISGQINLENGTLISINK